MGKRMSASDRDLLQFRLDNVADQIESLRRRCRGQEDVTHQDEEDIRLLEERRADLIKRLGWTF